MTKFKYTLLASLTFILPVFFLNLGQNNTAMASPHTENIPAAKTKPILEATIQMIAYPNESLEALGVDPQQTSLNEALANAEVEYRYKLGLGTLVSYHGEIILITHDHWGSLEQIGMVQFRNAEGELLLELAGATFEDLIRYQDGGTMILGRAPGGDRSDYLGALIWTSQAKYGNRIHPAELGWGVDVEVGQTVLVARQARNGEGSVELITATVESIRERWGQPVYKLRTPQGESIMPGDSGGGVWLEGRFVGNMWKSRYTYSWNWDSQALEQEWTETSFGAGLPEFGEDVIPQMDTLEIIEPVESNTDGREF